MTRETVIKIPVEELAEVQRLLDSNELIPDCRDAEVYQKWTGKFPDGFECDIKLVNAEGGPYLDCVLFDHHGCELAVIEPAYSLPGEYTWHLGSDEYVCRVVKS